MDDGSKQDQKNHTLAAAYFFHIIKNHPFVDGNKRTGLMTALEFIDRNGFECNASDEKLYKLSLDTAVSQINKEKIAVFFKKYMKKIK